MITATANVTVTENQTVNGEVEMASLALLFVSPLSSQPVSQSAQVELFVRKHVLWADLF